MALTVSVQTTKYNSYAKRIVDHIATPLKIVVAKVTFDASYDAGGEAFDYSDYGIDELSAIMFEPSGTYLFEYDRTNKKIKVYSALGTEVTAATDLSSLSTYVTMIGY